VPLMTQSCVLCRPARNTMGEVMTQIDKDLADAKTLLPPISAVTNAHDTVMNALNVTGYQARIALYKRDYQGAIDAATTVIASGQKPLVSGTAFTGIWTDANRNEILFRRRYETSTGIGGLWTTTGGDIYIAPSDKLIAAYETGDIRRTAYIGYNTNGAPYVNKFFTSSKGGRIVDMKAMRMAEMYLIRAEAYAKLPSPNVAAGRADLNALQTARNATLSNPTTAQELVDAVMLERFKELAFEGFRFWDLKRNMLPVQRLASDANAEWQTLPVNSFRWVMPIPRQEIIANPNTVQNPGY
ncbi:MAG TPA: RagB/SusD family nutrient uptake outer membrane protein, partial [Flavisolibacter sp.]